MTGPEQALAAHAGETVPTGNTFDNTAHFYLKRAHVLSEQLGGVRAPLLRLLDEPSPLGR